MTCKFIILSSKKNLFYFFKMNNEFRKVRRLFCNYRYLFQIRNLAETLYTFHFLRYPPFFFGTQNKFIEPPTGFLPEYMFDKYALSISKWFPSNSVCTNNLAVKTFSTNRTIYPNIVHWSPYYVKLPIMTVHPLVLNCDPSNLVSVQNIFMSNTFSRSTFFQFKFAYKTRNLNSN